MPVYFGPIGEDSNDLMAYLTAIRPDFVLPEDVNPADHILEVRGWHRLRDGRDLTLVSPFFPLCSVACVSCRSCKVYGVGSNRKPNPTFTPMGWLIGKRSCARRITDTALADAVWN